jgi:hypothetical protein
LEAACLLGIVDCVAVAQRSALRRYAVRIVAELGDLSPFGHRGN